MNNVEDGVVQAPNWLKELEAKRERKLKSKLGHETGAGSPCFACKDSCPGLDLHFWRKICKNCRCGKENHDVKDDDAHDFVQFQLLGAKTRQPTTIVLPGNNDAIELEWAPKGSKEAVEMYLKELPRDALPIKGSSAAHERKQLLHKQIPVHDVDPTLCHALTEDETRQMNEYVEHLRAKSVGIGQLVNLHRPCDAQLVSTTIQHQIVEHANVPNISQQLANVTLGSRHDYENIDAFGQHKLASSLEAIKRQQDSDDELTDRYGNPIRAQYALLLDDSGVPIKDTAGNPIKTALDVFASPILSRSVVERLPKLSDVQYAILLDKHGAPLMNSHGHPIKKSINHPSSLLFDNNRRPECAVLLNSKGKTIRHRNGDVLKLQLDVYNSPIIERSLSELVTLESPKYVCYLDRNNTLIDDQHGNVIKHPLRQEAETPAMFALLLDEQRAAIKCESNGMPITASLDAYNTPIIDDFIVEKLAGRVPQYALLLDKDLTALSDGNQSLINPLHVYKEPIQDKFGNDIQPTRGILLDKNETAIKDSVTGAPITVALDVFARPVIDRATIDRLGDVHPEFVMFLDRNGAPILDKYNGAMKNVVANYKPYTSSIAGGKNAKGSMLLLDKNEQPLNDSAGNQIQFVLDEMGRPIINKSQLDALNLHEAQYAVLNNSDKLGGGGGNALLLDATGKRLRDNFGQPLIVQLDHNKTPILNAAMLNNQTPQYCVPLAFNQQPFVDPYGNVIKYRTPPMLFDKFGDVARPHDALLLDAEQMPLKDVHGNPIKVKLDRYHQPIITDSHIQNPRYALLLDRHGAPISNKNDAPLKVPVRNHLCDAYGKPLDVREATLHADGTHTPIVNEFGAPLRLDVDYLGRPQFADVQQPLVDIHGNPLPLERAILVSARDGLTLHDSKSQPVRLVVNNDGDLHLHNTLNPVLDCNGARIAMFTPPAIDKYGNQIDPKTGLKLPSYQAANKATTQQLIDEQQPKTINIGAISDVEYEPPPQCHKCGQIFDDNALVIQIARSDALWHAACFKCAGCNQSLADLVYFYDADSDDIYCGRDFATIRGIPRCQACDELIFVKEYCLAENATYHVKHFCCFECDTPLAGQNYVAESGQQPVCIGCFERLKAGRCGTCTRIIGADEQGANLNGAHFHANDACFACRTCKRPLLGGKFLFRNDRLFCSGACFTQDQDR